VAISAAHKKRNREALTPKDWSACARSIALKARDLLQSAIAVEPNYALPTRRWPRLVAQLGYDEKCQSRGEDRF